MKRKVIITSILFLFLFQFALLFSMDQVKAYSTQNYYIGNNFGSDGASGTYHSSLSNLSNSFSFNAYRVYNFSALETTFAGKYVYATKLLNISIGVTYQNPIHAFRITQLHCYVKNRFIPDSPKTEIFFYDNTTIVYYTTLSFNTTNTYLSAGKINQWCWSNNYTCDLDFYAWSNDASTQNWAISVTSGCVIQVTYSESGALGTMIGKAVTFIPILMLIIAVPILLTEEFQDKKFFGIALILMTVLATVCGFIETSFSILAVIIEIVIIIIYAKNKHDSNGGSE